MLQNSAISNDLDRTNLHDGESLDPSGMRNMGTSAQIDEWATPVHGGAATIWDLVLKEVNLVLAVFEHLE